MEKKRGVGRGIKKGQEKKGWRDRRGRKKE
jgi:hypothetical protein